MSNTEYPGETDGKRLARLAVYDRVRALQPASVRAESNAVVLAGPDAGEIGCLRDFLKFKGERTWFVDNKDQRGLSIVERNWKEANTAYMDVKDALRMKNNISFLHLDFMGYLNEVRVDIIRDAAPRIARWGMVFYVFFRGRERDDVGFWAEMQGEKEKTLDGKRFVGGARILQQALGSEFLPVFALRYTSVAKRIKATATKGGSARKGDMGIIGFQKLPGGTSRSDYWLNMLEQPSPYGGVVPTDEKLLREYMRLEAIRLRRCGHNSKEVAAILNVGSGTVAAWFALESRGAYNS